MPTTPMSLSTSVAGSSSTRRSTVAQGHLGQRWFDGWVASRFRRAVGVLGSARCRGRAHAAAGVGLGESTHLAAVEDQPERVTIDSTIIGDIVAQAEAAADRTVRGGQAATSPSTPELSTTALDRAGPSSVTTFDLASLLSPGDRFTSSIGGTLMRCSDGVHFTTAAGPAVATRLFPVLASLGRRHHDTSPRGRFRRHPAPGRPLVDQRAQLLSRPMGARPGAEAAPEDGTTSGPEDGTQLRPGSDLVALPSRDRAAFACRACRWGPGAWRR